MNKKAQTYLGVSILSVIMVYGFYIMNLKTRLINEKGRYTIGVIQRTKIGSKGIRVFINYSYGNKVELVDYIEDYVERNKLRAELDSIIAHIYGLTEEEFTYILSTFPIVAQPQKVAAHNAYRDVLNGTLNFI